MVQIMAWRRPGDKPLSEPMMVSLPTHICVARPQWVKTGVKWPPFNNYLLKVGDVINALYISKVANVKRMLLKKVNNGIVWPQTDKYMGGFTPHIYIADDILILNLKLFHFCNIKRIKHNACPIILVSQWHEVSLVTLINALANERCCHQWDVIPCLLAKTLPKHKKWANARPLVTENHRLVAIRIPIINHQTVSGLWWEIIYP